MKSRWQQRKTPAKYVARDFYRRRYGNPLFGRRDSRSGRSENGRGSRKTVAAMIAVAIMCAAAWYVVWSPAFQIDNIEVDGASPALERTIRDLVTARMAQSRVLIFQQSQVLFFDALEFRRDLGTVYFLDSLELRKKMPHTLVILAKERSTAAILASKSRFLALDATGSIIRDLTESEVKALDDLPPDISAVPVQGLGATEVEIKNVAKPSAAPAQPKAPPPKNKSVLPLVVDRDLEERRIGEILFSPSTMTLVLQASSRLSDIAGTRTRWFAIDDRGATVTATMSADGGEGDWRVLMTTELPFEAQAERFALVLKEKIGAKKPQLEYVDLRYNERIFYRLRQQPASPPK